MIVPYRAPLWLRGGHAQTIWPSRLRCPKMALRRELVRTYTAAVAMSLRMGQEDGSVRADLDIDGAAVALTSMVDRTCYLRFVFDRQPGQGVEPTVDVLTDIWWAAVRA